MVIYNQISLNSNLKETENFQKNCEEIQSNNDDDVEKDESKFIINTTKNVEMINALKNS